MLSGCGPAGRRCLKEFCLGMAPSLPRQPLGPQHIPQREPRRAHLSRLNQRPPRQPQRTGKLGTAGGSRSVRHRQDCGGFHGATGELANRTFPNGRSQWQVGAMGGETGGDWASGRGTRAAIRSFCRRERPNLRGERCIALVNWRWDPSGPLPGDDQSPRGASTVTTRGKAPRQRPFQFKKTRCANRGVNPPVPPQRTETRDPEVDLRTTREPLNSPNSNETRSSDYERRGGSGRGAHTGDRLRSGSTTRHAARATDRRCTKVLNDL